MVWVGFSSGPVSAGKGSGMSEKTPGSGISSTCCSWIISHVYNLFRLFTGAGLMGPKHNETGQREDRGTWTWIILLGSCLFVRNLKLNLCFFICPSLPHIHPVHPAQSIPAWAELVLTESVQAVGSSFNSEKRWRVQTTRRHLWRCPHTSLVDRLQAKHQSCCFTGWRIRTDRVLFCRDNGSAPVWF